MISLLSGAVLALSVGCGTSIDPQGGEDGEIAPVSRSLGALDTDRICGRDQPRDDAYWAERSRVYLGSEEVELYGLSWFGLELPDRAPHGIWAHDLDTLLGRVRDLGFTALRIPLSPESIRPGFPSASWARLGEADTGREHLEAVLDGARRFGLRVLLAFHTCNSGQIAGSLPGSPTNCPNYQLGDWFADLETLAELSNTYFPTVVGVDLINEPHALTWSAWRELARQGGEVVLCTNPRVLVFVEGVGNASDNGGFSVFWGENLTEAGRAPVALPASKLVYSPHVYGPSVAQMPYFRAWDYPRNLPAIWDVHFGHLDDAGANVVPGEFGGTYDDARAPGDVAFQDALVEYFVARDLRNTFYWSLNPNSGDTGGLLLDDWTTPNTAKLNLLKRLRR